MTRTWTKTYPTAAHAQTAAAHYDWIRDVGHLHVPDLLHRDGPRLIFTRVPGRHATPTDLPDLADVLARFHTAAHQHLADTPPPNPTPLPTAGSSPDFATTANSASSTCSPRRPHPTHR